MLKSVQSQLGKNAEITAPYKKLCTGENEQTFDNMTRAWAQARHELSNTERDQSLGAVRLLANVSYEVFSQTSFGFFQHVQKEPFTRGYVGRFRVTHGKPPHTEYFTYSGSHAFSELEAFVVSPERSEALPLAPLMFWYPCSQHRDLENGHCFLFDKFRGEGSRGEATFKAANHTCSISASSTGELAPLVKQLSAWKTQDPKLDMIDEVKLAKEQVREF